MKRPGFYFYTGDWLKDTNLSKTNLAARGAWIDLICRMQEAGGSGVLQGTLEELSQLARTNEKDMKAALDVLRGSQTATVTFRNGKIIVINKRIRREYLERKRNAERQKRYRQDKASRRCHKNVAPLSSSSLSISHTLSLSGECESLLKALQIEKGKVGPETAKNAQREINRFFQMTPDPTEAFEAVLKFIREHPEKKFYSPAIIHKIVGQALKPEKRDARTCPKCGKISSTVPGPEGQCAYCDWRKDTA